jgi:hypothetical protein
MTVHQNFTASERKNAKAKHSQFKKNQPVMFNEQRNQFIQAMVEAKEVNLNISSINLNYNN